MGINTITQAFEKTEREKEGKIKTYQIGMCLSLGLNIIIAVLILLGII
jgi:heme/copper-type cytochrome/quinol oxidase subunit 4